jgi:hypothetical protein
MALPALLLHQPDGYWFDQPGAKDEMSNELASYRIIAKAVLEAMRSLTPRVMRQPVKFTKQ